MIKAIETRYKGYRFRSRLEARWAVFFDALGLEWQYEAQGFEADGKGYLPDFEITDPSGNTIYAEVKGDKNGISGNRYDCERYGAFARACKSELVLLGSIPIIANQVAFHPIIEAVGVGITKTLATFASPKAPYARVRGGDILSTLCDLKQQTFTDAANPDLWLVDCRIADLTRFFPAVVDAYNSARSARFEHSELGA